MTQYSVMGGCQQMQMWEIVTEEIGEKEEGAVIVTDCNNPRLDKSGLWDSRGPRECEVTVQDVIP